MNSTCPTPLDQLSPFHPCQNPSHNDTTTTIAQHSQNRQIQPMSPNMQPLYHPGSQNNRHITTGSKHATSTQVWSPLDILTTLCYHPQKGTVWETGHQPFLYTGDLAWRNCILCHLIKVPYNQWPAKPYGGTPTHTTTTTSNHIPCQWQLLMDDSGQP